MDRRNPGLDARNGSEERQPITTVMGGNPYFPETPAPQPKESQQEGSEMETAANDEVSTETGNEPVVEEQEQFMSEEEVPEGMDLESPEAKHFQAAYTKQRQRDREEVSSLKQTIAALEAKIQNIGAPDKPDIDKTLGHEDQRPTVLQVPHDQFDLPALPDEFAGYEDIVPLVKWVAGNVGQRTIDYIAEQQQAMFAEQQREQAVAQIGTFVESIPDQAKRQEAINMVKEYGDFARTHPDKFVTMVTNALGVGKQPEAPPAASPPPQQVPASNMAARQQAATPRPTRTGAVRNAQAQFTGPDATRRAIEAAMDDLGL